MEQVSEKVSVRLRAKYKEPGNKGAIKDLSIELGMHVNTVSKFKSPYVVEQAIPFLERWKAKKIQRLRAQEIESEKRFLKHI